MKLIDANALRAAMYHDAFETDSDMQKWDGGCWIRYKMFEDNIKAAPAVDAELVRHGTWTEWDDENVPALFRRKFQCSCCGRSSGYGKSAYCPHCGAKMKHEGQ